jgi:hypothetical protein
LGRSISRSGIGSRKARNAKFRGAANWRALIPFYSSKNLEKDVIPPDSHDASKAVCQKILSFLS